MFHSLCNNVLWKIDPISKSFVLSYKQPRQIAIKQFKQRIGDLSPRFQNAEFPFVYNNTYIPYLSTSVSISNSHSSWDEIP